MYKKIIFPGLLFAFSCNEDSISNNNPTIPNYSFRLEINLNFPSNSSLQLTSHPIINHTVGARGIFVFNTGSAYVAFDLACPNVTFEECTAPMTIAGIEARCDCDETTSRLFSGQGNAEPDYTMKSYPVAVNGTLLTVSS